jgi:uncharacterized protein YdaT
MITVQVYMIDGRVFEYDVADQAKAIEHAHAIVTEGYRHAGKADEMEEWYPAHRVLKVKYLANTSNYYDRVRGT